MSQTMVISNQNLVFVIGELSSEFASPLNISFLLLVFSWSFLSSVASSVFVASMSHNPLNPLP